MSESDFGFIEDEKNEMVIIIDSQDQEGFSAVEEIVNEENILIEGFLWDDEPILNEMSQIYPIESNDSDDAMKETLVENTSEEYGDDDLEYVIINNLEEIELENKIASRDVSEDECLVDDGKEKCFEIVKMEDHVACTPNKSELEETRMSSMAEKSSSLNCVLRNYRLEALASKFLVLTQAQVFVAITYLKRVQEIVRKRPQRFRKYDRSVILSIRKGKSPRRASKLKLLDHKSHEEDPLVKYKQGNGKEEQAGDLTLQGDLEVECLTPEHSNGVFELPLFNQITFGNGATHSETSAEEVVIIIEAEDFEEAERDNSTESRIFEICEKLERQDCHFSEETVVCPETEKNLELNQHVGPLEMVDDCVAQVSEIEKIPEPESDSDPVFLESGESKSDLMVESRDSILKVEFKKSQDHTEFEAKTPSHESHLWEDGMAVSETPELQLASPSNAEDGTLKKPEPLLALLNHFQESRRENNPIKDEKSTPESAKEGDCDGLAEFIEESINEFTVSQNTLQEEEGKVFRAGESPRPGSEGSFELSIKDSQEPPNLSETASLEEIIDCDEVKKDPTPVEEAGNGQTEAFEETSQKDSVSKSSPESLCWRETKVENSGGEGETGEDSDKPGHAKTGIFEPAVQDFQGMKEPGSSPHYGKLGTSSNRKPLGCSPYHSFQGKKSFGVFDKLVSLAQGRSIARAVSKDLSIESMRAIDIIKKGRKPK